MKRSCDDRIPSPNRSNPTGTQWIGTAVIKHKRGTEYQYDNSALSFNEMTFDWYRNGVEKNVRRTHALMTARHFFFHIFLPLIWIFLVFIYPFLFIWLDSSAYFTHPVPLRRENPKAGTKEKETPWGNTGRIGQQKTHAESTALPDLIISFTTSIVMGKWTAEKEEERRRNRDQMRWYFRAMKTEAMCGKCGPAPSACHSGGRMTSRDICSRTFDRHRGGWSYFPHGLTPSCHTRPRSSPF